MAYILGLFLILALIFSSVGGSHLFGNLLGQVKDKITATIFPKTEREIIIDNLNSDNQNLDKFFSETAPAILNSKSVSETDKAAVKKAVESFNSSKALISNLSKLESAGNSPLKTVGTLIEKVLSLNGNSSQTYPNSNNSINSSNSNPSTPTNIPPQCHLECGK